MELQGLSIAKLVSQIAYSDSITELGTTLLEDHTFSENTQLPVWNDLGHFLTKCPLP